MNKVLITGGAGFIGSHTADVFLNQGYEVTIIDALLPKNYDNYNFPSYLDKRIKLVKGNVLDRDLMLLLLKENDYVIHLAAEMDLNPDFTNFMNVNVGSTALIYELIVKHKINIKKVLIASTQFVYGEGIWNCLEHGNFSPEVREKTNLEKEIWDHKCPICNKTASHLVNTEESLNPPNHYALSKYFQELTAIRIGKLYAIPTVIARYSIVHGPRQSLKNTYSGALRNFTLSIYFDIELATFEDNNSLRDFISVYDVANANLLLIEDNKANFNVYNVSGDKSYKISELAKMVSNALGKEHIFSKKSEFRIGDIRHAISSNLKLKNLGWTPIHNEESTISEYVQWFLTQKINKDNFIFTQKKIRELGIVLPIKL